MAGRLRDRGREVSQLVLLDSSAPVGLGREVSDVHVIAQLLRDLSGEFGAAPPSIETLMAASIGELEEQGVTYVKRLRLFPPGSELAELRRHTSMYHAHMNSHLRYDARPYDSPMLYISADASTGRVEKWRELARGEFVHLPVPLSRHSNLLRQPHVTLVAETINKMLSVAVASRQKTA
jgi:thioesterase domain-containing protein